MSTPGTTLHPGLYRKKPVEVEAVRWAGDRPGADAIVEWVCTFGDERDAELVKFPDAISIRTLEGDMDARPGDWIIRGVKGEFYPCKPDIFEATYEPVHSEPQSIAADYAESAE